jgi:hypothetical protein
VCNDPVTRSIQKQYSEPDAAEEEEEWVEEGG